MDRALYIAMTGARQIELAQAINTNNLANVSTDGFRAELAAFRAMPVFGPGQPTRVYAMAERPGVDLSAGKVTTTGRDLDIAVNGEGWIVVQARDGSEGLTRAGNLRVSSVGQLETGDGLAVMGNDGPIAIPDAESIEIGADGTISVRPLGLSANSLTVVDRIRLVNPEAGKLYKGKDGLMRARGAALVPDASVTLVNGALESSNVNAVEAMVNMIALARQYEMQIKVMKTTEENDAASARLMRLS